VSPRDDDPTDDGPPIASVDNALQVLLMLQRSPSVRISDASAELGVGVSTAHRVMAALGYRGFVEQDPQTRAYKAGPALASVGLAAIRNLGVRGLLRPLLESLRDELDETIHLATLQGPDIQYIDSVEAHRSLRTTTRVGMTMPAHCSSGGKALLAALPSEMVRQLYPTNDLATRTDRSISTWAELQRELETVREHGYAVADGEGEIDIAAVGVVVRDAARRPRVAIVASGPRSRIEGPTVARIAASLQRTAEQGAALLA
jgi:DNA-binding IclR family transcriptional regulator